MLFFVVGRAVVVVVVLVGGERGGCAREVAVLLLLSQAAQGGSRYCVKKEFHSLEYVSPNKYHVSLAFAMAVALLAVDVVVASSSK